MQAVVDDTDAISRVLLLVLLQLFEDIPHQDHSLIAVGSSGTPCCHQFKGILEKRLDLR